MSDEAAFEPPVITDEDIRWASRLLGLSDDAFFGRSGTDPRREVLKSMDPIDVAACPGSGKTTLLVAKLAILAQKWKDRTRGICVLSHTNAARREIETRLGNTAAGQGLLGYPHFVGTIHTFVNEFLALPWLRSRGIPVKMIDDDEVERRRRSLIANQDQFRVLRQFVQNKEQHANLVASWIIGSPGYTVLKTSGEPAFKTPVASASQLSRVVEIVACNGYHRFGEMFMWARELMEKSPGVVAVLRGRFPLLFLDEAQDNSEEQAELLYRIFIDAGAPVIRQRFGDPNQAIFNFVGAKGATTDDFTRNATRTLPNSHRFGQKIANLADPLGIKPYTLVGQGPKKPLASDRPQAEHCIFLFGETSAEKVLDAYGRLLVETFSKEELREGSFAAIGQVHKVKGDDKKPRHVGHYWPSYDPELAVADPKPQSFVQYVFAGQGKASIIGEAYAACEKIAEGVLHLVGLNEGKTVLRRGRHRHRNLLHLLEDSHSSRASYEDLITWFAQRREVLTEASWDDRWRETVREIAEAVAGASLSNSEADNFLAWRNEEYPDASAPQLQDKSDNIYRYPLAHPRVRIRVGSIHSVKGETHTATLVLETFWKVHNLAALLPWLGGRERGKGSAGKEQMDRLKLHYVAMTRPAHLLCLAMKCSSFEDGDGELDKAKIEAVQSHGWNVRQVV